MLCSATAPSRVDGVWARPPDVGKRRWAGVLGIAVAMLLATGRADAITIIWQSANTTINVGQLTYSAVEFENPLTGSEIVLGYRVLEWRDADYDDGPPRWYDDWLVSNSAAIDGHPCEIWMRGNGQWIRTTTSVPSGVVSIHLHGDSNDGLASVWVDGAEVARLDMYSSPPQNAVIIVRDLALGPHTIEVRDLGAGAGGGDVATLGAAVLGFVGEIEPKWVQPPEMPQPGQIYGWDEPSIYGGPQLAADDWVCTTDDPVVAVRWWGSFLGWQEQTLPPLPPRAYHLAIWTDVPGMPPDPFSHPGLVLWEAECVPSEVRFAGYDLDPRMPTIPDACFEFYCELPERLWFHQSPGAHVYWLSIAAIYPPGGCNGDFDNDGDVDPFDVEFFVFCQSGLPDPRCAQADLNGDGVVNFFDITIMQCQLQRGWPDPDCCPAPPPPAQPPNPFGWKTRPHRPTNPDDAVRIFAPLQPHGGMMFEQGMPIYWPDPTQSWDLSFVLYARSPEPQGACCVNWTCSVVTSEECARLGGRFLGEGTTCGPPNPCEIRDRVVCEPQGSAGRPFHPPTYWYEVTPVGGFGRCDFHVKVLDPNPANYTNVVAPPTWLFAVHQVGADWWASWWDPDCDNAIFATFRFQFDNPNPNDWNHWTTTISSTSDPENQVIDRSEWHAGEPDGLGYRVHVPLLISPITEACCLRDGGCIDVEAYRCIVELGGVPQGVGTRCAAGVVCPHAKWTQPPTAPDIPPPLIFGWNEPSQYGGPQIVADDWYCLDERPVTDIHWWGSYVGWEDGIPPPNAPPRFHIGIWTDVPAMPPLLFSHPGTMVWEIIVPREMLHERPVGVDHYPDMPRDTCFQYSLQLPPGMEFVQDPAGQEIYWISIAAIYPGVCNADFDGDGDVDAADLEFFIQCFQGPPTPRCWRADLNGDGLVDLSDLVIMQCQLRAGWPDPACCPPTIPLQWPWGWKTRRPSWNDDGVRVTAPTVPAPGSRFQSGTPIFGPEGSWDLAFVLTTTLPPLAQACCVQSPAGNFCIEVPAWDCLFRHGGTPQGPGTTCPQVVPSIVQQPRDQDVCERTQVTISVVAQGSPPLAYQWFKDNAPLPGATGPSHVIASADPQDNGRYHVVVSNACGTVASRQARLTVWLHADANCDGAVNNFDIDAFVLAISDPGAWRQQYTCDFLCANDCNGDGRVDNFDIDAFVTCISLGRCP